MLSEYNCMPGGTPGNLLLFPGTKEAVKIRIPYMRTHEDDMSLRTELTKQLETVVKAVKQVENHYPGVRVSYGNVENSAARPMCATPMPTMFKTLGSMNSEEAEEADALSGILEEDEEEADPPPEVPRQPSRILRVPKCRDYGDDVISKLEELDCTEGVVDEIIEMMCYMAAKGVAETIPCKGLFVIAGEKDRLMDGSVGSFGREDLNRFAQMDVTVHGFMKDEEVKTEVTPIGVMDKAVVFDGISGRILANKFTVENLDKGTNNDGDRLLQAASAVAHEGFLSAILYKENCMPGGIEGSLLMFLGTGEAIEMEIPYGCTSEASRIAELEMENERLKEIYNELKEESLFKAEEDNGDHECDLQALKGCIPS
uniref:Uncharacterized protein n=1 Tax=Octactis speculum TaxID=3111310 RepID=A0A7S2C500_9STRA|mmetsp:Transcript_31504/g.42663  ORF Transcript_31504/g.42663 Transcript_31504/m.42663 type:complete len:371 (+) Transcript_31504:1621-2733(+)